MKRTQTTGPKVMIFAPLLGQIGGLLGQIGGLLGQIGGLLGQIGGLLGQWPTSYNVKKCPGKI